MNTKATTYVEQRRKISAAIIALQGALTRHAIFEEYVPEDPLFTDDLNSVLENIEDATSLLVTSTTVPAEYSRPADREDLPRFKVADGQGVEEALRAWTKALFDAGLLFHFDDDPLEIIDMSSNSYTFSEGDAYRVRYDTSEMFRLAAKLDVDPFEYALELTNPQD